MKKPATNPGCPGSGFSDPGAQRATKPMLVAGVMSGTSADGIDVAICRITPTTSTTTLTTNLSSRPKRSAVERPASQLVQPPKLKVLAHESSPFSPALRKAALAAQDATSISVAELSRLQTRLSETYAEAIAATAAQHNLKPQLVALHGQTIYHQATAAPYLGKPLRTTWQLAEPAIVAHRLGIPVVSNFRPADLAAGGQGAPLVPMLDFCLFQHATRNRVLLNLGGIANLTALPASGTTAEVLAFDTGPANMLVDATMRRFFNRSLDRNGATAARGHILPDVLTRLLADPYFSAPPPKSCGREQFGEAYLQRFLKLCERDGILKQDAVATATALTSESILEAYRRFVWPHLGQRAPLARATELLVAGGGAHNKTLMHQLTQGFAQLGVKVTTTAANGLAIEAKEAAAFALLGWLTWHGLPGNIPYATGAAKAVILGSITHV